MNSINENTHTSTRVRGTLRAASRTVRKFTQFFGSDALPRAVSVHIDWLSFMVETFMAPPDPEQPNVMLNDRVGTQYIGHGSMNFLYSHNIILDGEVVGMIHTHTRNEVMIEKNSAKFEIKNQVLYSSEWTNVITDCLAAMDITYIKNITRLDIALDGANHITPFLNAFAHDHSGRIGMKGRARLTPRMMDKKTKMFDGWQIGAGHKYITIYNKTREIDEKSHKEYIRDCWRRAGLDLEAENWRCELRLDSQAINSVKAKETTIVEPDGKEKFFFSEGISLDRLSDPNYLLKLFKTHCENFFQFVVFEGDSNVTRARIIDLFQFEKLRVALLEKIPRAVVRGAYKARMAIHNAFSNILLKRYKGAAAIAAAWGQIHNEIELYDLNRYFEKKKPDWIALYNPAYAPIIV